MRQLSTNLRSRCQKICTKIDRYFFRTHGLHFHGQNIQAKASSVQVISVIIMSDNVICNNCTGDIMKFNNNKQKHFSFKLGKDVHDTNCTMKLLT